MAFVQKIFASCRFIMSQNRALQDLSGTCLSCTPFKLQVRLCSSSTRIQFEGLRYKSEQRLYALKSYANGGGVLAASIVHPTVRVGSPSTSIINLHNQLFLTPISKRSLSQVSAALTRQHDASSTKDGWSGEIPTLKQHNKRGKGKQGFAAVRENAFSIVSPERNCTKVKTAATRGPDTMGSRDLLALKDKKDLELESPDCNVSEGSIATGKPKKTRGKTTKSLVFDTKADCHEAAQLKCSEKVSRSKKPSSPAVSKISSIKSTCTKTPENNVSSKSNKSSRKQKTKKEVADVANSSVSMEDLSRSSLSESQTSLIFGGTSNGNCKFPQLFPPIAKSVLVVESETKAKVIQGYLGDMFEVLPSYGHVRDLAGRSGSVRPHDNFSMVWEVPTKAWKHLKSIKVALIGAKNLILASDPDREGEAIAWHIIEMMQQQDALRGGVSVARVVFNEITESSIKSALQAPRSIDLNLVRAYLARRALDYLIGFNISPVLWRKLPGCKSAGRVQSAALALISDREAEIHDFKPQEYWTVEVEFNKKKLRSENSIRFSSNLIEHDFKKLNRLSIGSCSEADLIKEHIRSSIFQVIASKKSKSRRNPPNPYITSTLQQDAANKLNFAAATTMRVAQKLYEGVQLSDGKAVGLITYMRTDGLHISDEAAADILSFVREKYGQTFAPKAARKYFKKVKNAQEAHEAIRPTNIRRLPSILAGVLDDEALELYTLIWSRTVACQMEPAILEHIQLDIGNISRSIVLRSSCSRVEFPGYQAVFRDFESSLMRLDGNEGKVPSELFEVLSSLETGDSLGLGHVETEQHHTQPPSRYSEGSLVKKLEELGIGRPSTYASTIKVLKDRNYITVKIRVLYPEFRGRMVSAFLTNYFSEVTDYSFTADMETELDNVSAGSTEWKGLLRDYWTRFSEYCTRAGNLHIHQVEKVLEKSFSNFLFASLPNGSRTCPSCSDGTLIFKVSRLGEGYFLGCDKHPQCKYIAKKLYSDDDEDTTADGHNKSMDEPTVLLKSGPYGHYIQLGENKYGFTPKRVSLNKVQKKDLDSVTLEVALELLMKYPKTLGTHPKDDKDVVLLPGKGHFYIRCGCCSVSIPKAFKIDDVTLEKALELLNGPNVKRIGRPPAKEKQQRPKSMLGLL